MSAVRDYRSEPYPVSAEIEQAEKRAKAGEAARARGKRLRDLAVLCLAALDGAHGETARLLAEEGLAEHRGHALALRRWYEADAESRKLEADERRAILRALEAFNLEHTLSTLAREVRKEIAKNFRKEPRR